MQSYGLYHKLTPERCPLCMKMAIFNFIITFLLHVVKEEESIYIQSREIPN